MTALDRPTGDLLSGRLVHVTPATTLRAAAAELFSETVGALLVRTPSADVGIFTERDLVRALAEGADPDDARVAEYLTEDLMTVPSSTPLWDTLQKMRINDLRHVVVQDGAIVRGVVSMRAVVDASMRPDGAVA